MKITTVDIKTASKRLLQAELRAIQLFLNAPESSIGTSDLRYEQELIAELDSRQNND